MKAVILSCTDGFDFAYSRGFDDGTAALPQRGDELGVDALAVYLDGYLDGLRFTMPLLSAPSRYTAETYRAGAIALAVVLEELK